MENVNTKNYKKLFETVKKKTCKVYLTSNLLDIYLCFYYFYRRSLARLNGAIKNSPNQIVNSISFLGILHCFWAKKGDFRSSLSIIKYCRSE